MTSAQNIAILQRRLGVRDRRRALAQVSVLLSRPVRSRKEIKAEEVPPLMYGLRLRAERSTYIGAGTSVWYLVDELREMAADSWQRQLVEEVAIRLLVGESQ